MNQTGTCEGGQGEGEVYFESPAEVILWASRLYLSHTVEGRRPPPILDETFSEARLSYMYEALKRLLDRILVGANTKLVLHQPACRRLAIHEQALLAGLRCLQRQSGVGYKMTMASILPPAVTRVLRDDMEIVAGALTDMERFWPKASVQAVADPIGGAARPRGAALH